MYETMYTPPSEKEEDEEQDAGKTLDDFIADNEEEKLEVGE
jgi:hypothetical protein